MTTIIVPFSSLSGSRAERIFMQSLAGIVNAVLNVYQKAAKRIITRAG